MKKEHLKILAEVKKWELSHLDLVQSVQCVTPLEALAAMQRLQEQIDELKRENEGLKEQLNPEKPKQVVIFTGPHGTNKR